MTEQGCHVPLAIDGNGKRFHPLWCARTPTRFRYGERQSSPESRVDEHCRKQFACGWVVRSGRHRAVPVELEVEFDEFQPTLSMRATLVSPDDVDLSTIFCHRGFLMESLPFVLRGAYRTAVRMTLTEIEQGYIAQDIA